MSTSATALPKDDFLAQIYSISTTLTEEAMAAASAKVAEKGFDPNRGLITLPESFINLSSARAVLEDAIDKRKLIQLPLTVQKEILANLETISKSLLGLSDGVDEIANLVNAVESLNTTIWKYGLHNLSDQVLGYQTKLNQLKNQELEISKAVAALRASRKIAEKASSDAAEIAKHSIDVATALELVNSAAASSTGTLQQVKESENKINAVVASVQQHEKQSGELTSNIKTANNELLSLDGSIRKFYSEVDYYRKKINETGELAAGLLTRSESEVKNLIDTADSKIEENLDLFRQNATALKEQLEKDVAAGSAQSQAEVTALTSSTREDIDKLRTSVESELHAVVVNTQTSASTLVSDTTDKLKTLEENLEARSEETIETNHKQTQAILKELDDLKGQVKAQIQQATGFTLFGAFQSRQNQVAQAKRVWAYVIGGLVLISVAITSWIAYEAQLYTTHSLAFYVKLSLTVPLAFAITFCAVQYSRERRLEEEYAFKASISVSLNPYKDLVQAIIKEDEHAELGKYTEFVIDSVKNVFTSPTDKVFDAEKKSSGVSEKVFKQVAEIIGTGVKAAKS
jgi:hypothetical protein